MSLERLIQRIREESENEINSIISEAEEKAKEIVEEEKEKGRKDAEKIKNTAIKDAERIKEKIIAGAKRKARMYMTNAKEDVIKLCFDTVRKKLMELDGEKYVEVVTKMVEEVIKEMGDAYIISTRKEDKKIAKKLGLEIKGKKEGIGGIIIKSKDGSKEVDLTFDFLLDRKKEEIRISIAKKLFEE